MKRFRIRNTGSEGSAAETACTTTLRCGSGYTHFAGLWIRIRDRLDPAGVFFAGGWIQILIFFEPGLKWESSPTIYLIKVKVKSGIVDEKNSE